MTWKPAANDIGVSAPGDAVKGGNVVPDRKPGQDAVCLSLDEDALAVGVNLDGADRYVSEDKVT